MSTRCWEISPKFCADRANGYPRCPAGWCFADLGENRPAFCKTTGDECVHPLCDCVYDL